MKVKKILLTLGSILVCGIGLTNGQYIEGPREGKNDIGERTLNIKEATYDQNIEKNIELKTAIISNELTDYKNVFGIYNNPFIIFYRNTEGTLSYYWGGTWKIGGKVKNYTVCDYKENTLENYTNCTNIEYTGENIEILNNMLSKTKTTDNYYYGNAHRYGDQANLMIPYITINIEEINKSIIFLIDIYFGNGDSNNLGIPAVTNGTYTIDYRGDYTYENFPTENIGNTPIINNGGTNTGGNIETNKLCQPIQFQIDLYGYKYNTGLCYSNEQIISGGEVINETQMNIFEAFPTYQDYRNGYNLIGNYCHTEQGNTYEECQTALQSIGKKQAQILYKTIQAELPTNKVYQYCHLQLDFTEEEKRDIGRCELTDEEKYATGVNQETSNPNALEGYENMLLQSSSDIFIPGEGTVFDEILPDGIITRKNLTTNFDFIGDLIKLMAKISEIFVIRPNVEGIIPPVILSLLLLIVLFKIFKK